MPRKQTSAGLVGLALWVLVVAAPFNAWLNVAFDALDAWVDWHQSGGTAGSPPPHNLGGYNRE